MEDFTCDICNKEVKNEWANEPWPIIKEGKCCADCNDSVVLAARLVQLGIG